MRYWFILILLCFWSVPVLAQVPLLHTNVYGPTKAQDQNTDEKYDVDGGTSVNFALRAPVATLAGYKLLAGFEYERDEVGFTDPEFKDFKLRQGIRPSIGFLDKDGSGQWSLLTLDMIDSPAFDMSDKVYQLRYIYSPAVSPLKGLFPSATSSYLMIQLRQFPNKEEFRFVAFQKFQSSDSHLIISFPNQIEYSYYHKPKSVHYLVKMHALGDASPFSANGTDAWAEASFSGSLIAGAELFYGENLSFIFGAGLYTEQVKYIDQDGKTLFYYRLAPAPAGYLSVQAYL